MKLRWLGMVIGCFVALAAWAQPARAQQAAPPGADLQKQVDALRDQVRTLQKDLDEIKALLAPLRAQQAPSVPENAVIDLGQRPLRGAPAARLTFIELTDYQ